MVIRALSCVVAAVLAAQATNPAAMIGGGEFSIRKIGDELHVVVTGPRAGLASLCVADDSRVRILHASAAVGEATYERSAAAWLLKSTFDFKLRDSRRDGPPTDADRSQYFNVMGWVANTSNAGNPRREFRIRSKDVRFLGISFMTTDEPMAVSYFPSSMRDDCTSLKVAQGYLPERAEFQPATWHRIE
jgi:hypothetical protein